MEGSTEESQLLTVTFPSLALFHSKCASSEHLQAAQQPTDCGGGGDCCPHSEAPLFGNGGLSRGPLSNTGTHLRAVGCLAIALGKRGWISVPRVMVGLLLVAAVQRVFAEALMGHTLNYTHGSAFRPGTQTSSPMPGSGCSRWARGLLIMLMERMQEN